MTVKVIPIDVVVRKDTKWKKNREKSNAQLEEEGFWEVWTIFCSYTALMIELIAHLEKPSAFPARVDRLKQPQANGALADIKQEEQWLEIETKQACASLQEQSDFQDLPGRIYTAAIHKTVQTFKGWLETQWTLLQRLSGKKRFLAVVESDPLLAEMSTYSWAEVCARAEIILAHEKAEIVENADDEAVVNEGKQLLKALLKRYDLTSDVLERRAIIHLLRNNYKVRHKPEKPEKWQAWIEGKRVEIERLEAQVPRLPRPRNLFPKQAYDELLEDLIRYPLSDVPESEKTAQLFYYRVLIWFFILHTNFAEHNPQMSYCLLHQVRAELERMEDLFFEWHDSISAKIDEFLKLPKSLPYPIYFGGSDLRSWHLNEENKICFKLNGLGDYLFEVRCDRRQLGLVKYFLEDWQTQAQSENQEYTGSFTLLRSAELLVKPKRSKQKAALPQADDRQAVVAAYKLSLHCAFDTDYLTRQGLERVRQRKIEAQLKGLNQKRAKLAEQQEQLQQLEQEMQQAAANRTRRSRRDAQRLKQIEKLQQSIEKLETEIQAILAKPNPKLERLRNSPLFRRPDRPLYAGITNLFIGVSLDLDKHLVVSVVDALRHKILTKRNVKQIMGKHYPLLQRYCHLKQEHSRQRQKNQKAGRQQRLSAADLGQQVACAIANGLVALAQQYKVSTIVLPDTQGWREHLYSQLVARARIKCRGCKKAMARYTKEQGKRLHQWDYKRLSQAIATEAQTIGITVLFQKPEFQQDAFQQAAQLAITAYDSLQSKNKKSQSEAVDSTLTGNRQ